MGDLIATCTGPEVHGVLYQGRTTRDARGLVRRDPGSESDPGARARAAPRRGALLASGGRVRPEGSRA